MVRDIGRRGVTSGSRKWERARVYGEFIPGAWNTCEVIPGHVYNEAAFTCTNNMNNDRVGRSHNGYIRNNNNNDNNYCHLYVYGGDVPTSNTVSIINYYTYWMYIGESCVDGLRSIETFSSPRCTFSCKRPKTSAKIEARLTSCTRRMSLRSHSCKGREIFRKWYRLWIGSVDEKRCTRLNVNNIHRL